MAKLELLPADVPYGRLSNLQLPVIVQNLELRLPVLEEPGAGPVATPLPKVVPPGYELAPGFAEGEEPEPPGKPLRCRGRTATIAGGPGDDVLPGTRRADVFTTRGGGDVIKGRRGRDRICAGPGNDVIRTGPGRDKVWTGRGRDTVDGVRER